jgi:hypothetical protein
VDSDIRMIGKQPIICGIRKNIMLLQQNRGSRAVSGARVPSFMRLSFLIRREGTKQRSLLKWRHWRFLFSSGQFSVEVKSSTGGQIPAVSGACREEQSCLCPPTLQGNSCRMGVCNT